MKILVCIYVPAISKKFDVWIPDFLSIKEIISLIVKAVKELSNSKYVSSGFEFLCLKEKNLLLKDNATLKEYGVRNGDNLILI